ncbi:MAG: PAS domain S-box protein [Desulfobacterales bacterium]|nr:PAS domain S-box protein [Desulfobacterales bacterium]
MQDERTEELKQLNDKLNLEILKRNEIEAELRESQFKLHTILEHSSNLFYIHTADHVLTYVSPQTRDLLDCEPEDAIIHWPEFVTSHPVNEKGFNITQKAIDTGIRQPSYELELIGKKGRKIWVMVNESPILENGKTIAIVGALTDITQRKAAEDALRDSEKQYRLLFEYAPMAIFIVQGAHIQFSNPKALEMLGYHDHEIPQIPLNYIVHPDDHNIVFTVLNNHETQNLSFRVLSKTGMIVWCNGNVVNINWNNQAASLFFLMDITKEKDLSEKFMHAQKMKAIGILAGGIAHDFNNLLMAIQGRASLIKLSINSSHSAYTHVQCIEEYVSNASDLTKQLLNFSKGGAYHFAPTDINMLIQKSVHMFGRMRKDIRMVTELAKDLWISEVDSSQIQQVLLNMYINAWQAMPKTGTLRIQTQNIYLNTEFVKPYTIADGNYIKISIIDDGIGIDDNMKDQIFEPFFTTKAIEMGTGLGLSSSYWIIKNHKGCITVHSQKNQGTQFDIYLPTSNKPLLQKQLSSKKSFTGNESILIVDDEIMILDIVKEGLTLLGYTVYIAQTGRDCLQLFAKNVSAISLVLIDLIMPEMDGPMIFDAIKRINSNSKVLICSGFGKEDIIEKMLTRGANGFIQKPFSIQDLSKKIREILD